MTCWCSCEEPSVDNDPTPKLKSLHIVLNEQHSSELHVTKNKQKVNKQSERDLLSKKD